MKNMIKAAYLIGVAITCITGFLFGMAMVKKKESNED